MILDRIDPDVVHPARLAGHRAWSRWGLTSPPTDETDVVLLVPDHDADRLVPEVVGCVARILERPAWPPSNAAVTVDGNHVVVRDGDASTTLKVVSHRWYLPEGTEKPPGAVVGRDRWPLIDEASAVRERVKAIDRTRPTIGDVDDLAGWVAAKATQAREYPLATGASLASLLTALRRQAPATYANIDSVVDFARESYELLPRREHVAATFRVLSHELASVERRRSR